jgi:hypothetical protein
VRKAERVANRRLDTHLPWDRLAHSVAKPSVNGGQNPRCDFLRNFDH